MTGTEGDRTIRKVMLHRDRLLLSITVDDGRVFTVDTEVTLPNGGPLAYAEDRTTFRPKEWDELYPGTDL